MVVILLLMLRTLITASYYSFDTFYRQRSPLLADDDDVEALFYIDVKTTLRQSSHVDVKAKTRLYLFISKYSRIYLDTISKRQL